MPHNALHPKEIYTNLVFCAKWLHSIYKQLRPRGTRKRSRKVMAGLCRHLKTELGSPFFSIISRAQPNASELHKSHNERHCALAFQCTISRSSPQKRAMFPCQGRPQVASHAAIKDPLMAITPTVLHNSRNYCGIKWKNGKEWETSNCK